MNTIVLALRATAVTLVLTGLLYPVAVWGIAQAAFPRQANGSFVTDEAGATVGSELIGQPFANPAYVQSRPSAAGTAKDGRGVEFTVSSGSNLGPTSKKLRDQAAALAGSLKKDNPDAKGDVPAELVTSSGSGLDPHLSPETVEWQVPRIAAARGVSEERVRAIVAEHAEGRDLGLLGEPRVNVLRLNLALDGRFGAPPAQASIPPK
jgi:potassium-transporting ATPase KdpC subunit